MVLVRTNVTREVYERLQNGETVEAVTNFDKIGFQTPYEFLKEISEFDNFFFGIAANSYFHERIDDMCELSSEDNVIKLMLDIPREELASMNYYDFSDLIFYTECEIDNDIAERVKIDLYERLNTHHLSPLDRDLIQVIYPRIDPSHIIAAEEVSSNQKGSNQIMTQTREIFQTAAKDFLQSLDGILSKADMKTLAFSLSANTGTIDIERVKKKEEELTRTRPLEASQKFKPSLPHLSNSPIFTQHKRSNSKCQ